MVGMFTVDVHLSRVLTSNGIAREENSSCSFLPDLLSEGVKANTPILEVTVKIFKMTQGVWMTL